MASKASEFTGTINVGGIQYTFDTSKSGINYLFRSYHDFVTTFRPVAERSGVPLPRIQQLFIKYFRVEPFVEQDFGAIVEQDKKDLIKIFEAYLNYLENSKAVSGNSVISIMLNRTYYEISNIILALKGKPEDFSEISVSCQQSKDKLKELDDAVRKQMILEFTWLLEHPNDIRSEAGCKWADMVSELTNIRLTDMTAQLKPEEEPAEEEKSDEKLYMANPDNTKGYHEWKKTGGAMKSRVKSLLTVCSVLQSAKWDEDDETYTQLYELLSKSMMPLFDHVKSLYKPVYQVIESCMKRNRVKKNKIITPLLKLLHISNHFMVTRKDAYGIYRIRNPGKRIVAYLTSQVQCIATSVDKMKPTKRREYHDIHKQLSPFIISSLPKRKAVGSSKKDVSLPTVQFLTLDGNLIIPPFEQFYRKGSESEKEQFFKVMTDYFTKDDIYMVYSQSDEIPLNFYEINLPSVDTADSYIPVTDYDSKRIIADHILQDFATLMPNAEYTNADLILSIFIALKEKRTK
jgi:hypothetical protein